VVPPDDEDELVGALTGAWTVVLPELSLDELELDPVVVEVEAGCVEAVVAPGMVTAPIAPKSPTPTTPPVAAHIVKRRSAPRRLSRSRAGSLGRCHVCMAPGCRRRLKQV
jgi:hypothetical protein